jgi:lysozyme
MNAVDASAVLCMRFEGFRASPYLCPAGVATIGFGSTAYANGIGVKLSDPAITRDAAAELLMHTLRTIYVPGVLKCCPGVSGNQLAALADFCYNLGVGRLKSSTLRRRVNAEDWDGARVELLKWTRCSGRVLRGLVARREAEAALI